jgi:hypothetical protein
VKWHIVLFVASVTDLVVDHIVDHVVVDVFIGIDFEDEVIKGLSAIAH